MNLNLDNRDEDVMTKTIDPRIHVGEVHGIYTLTDVLEEKDKYGHYIYEGTCNVCGYTKYSHYGDFSGASSITTVCRHIQLGGEYIQNIHWNNRRIGNIFGGIKTRCYDKNDKAYRWYGAKGIKICDEWMNNPKLFEEWAINNGYADNLTIDRINENKNYCPENCQWITIKRNAKYKSTTSLINIDGEIHTGREWADILHLGTNIINTYIRKYGEENTKDFIRKYLRNPGNKPKSKQSYYDLYMNNQDFLSF